MKGVQVKERGPGPKGCSREGLGRDFAGRDQAGRSVGWRSSTGAVHVARVVLRGEAPRGLKLLYIQFLETGFQG